MTYVIHNILIYIVINGDIEFFSISFDLEIFNIFYSFVYQIFILFFLVCVPLFDFLNQIFVINRIQIVKVIVNNAIYKTVHWSNTCQIGYKFCILPFLMISLLRKETIMLELIIAFHNWQNKELNNCASKWESLTIL